MPSSACGLGKTGFDSCDGEDKRDCRQGPGAVRGPVSPVRGMMAGWDASRYRTVISTRRFLGSSTPSGEGTSGFSFP